LSIMSQGIRPSTARPYTSAPSIEKLNKNAQHRIRYSFP
jgi:hypothetical protein